MPKVSVIVPIFQVELYLRECLDSIIAQSFSDYELILVDDGTQDGCPAIIEEYSKQDPRIRTIRKPNGGLSSARNAGMDIATGEYIAFIDADDRVDLDLLKDTVTAAETTNADLVLFNYKRFYEDHVEPAYLTIRDETIEMKELGLAEYFYRYWMPYVHGQEAWCRLYRRDIIVKNGLQFAPNREVFAEDTLFSAMYLMHVTRLTALSKAYVYYRQRGDSLMALQKPKLAERLMNLSVRLSAYVRETGHEKELCNVMPVLCYDKLICKGIRNDPNQEDVCRAMEKMVTNPEMRNLMEELKGTLPLTVYFLKTGKGLRTQWRGRAFAVAWLRGDIKKAISLVKGRE